MSPDIITYITDNLNNVDEDLKVNIQKLIKDYSKNLSRMEKIITQSDNQQLELVHMNEKIEAAYKKLKIASSTDKLTSLFTRSKCEETINYYQEVGIDFNIMIIDIDNFKHINEKYNALIGNQVLQEFSNILKRIVSKTSIISRWSGDTFLVIDSDLTLDETIDKAQNICEKIEDTFFNDIGELTVSIGIASSQKSNTLSGIITAFDKALKNAKDSGRNQVSI